MAAKASPAQRRASSAASTKRHNLRRQRHLERQAAAGVGIGERSFGAVMGRRSSTVWPGLGAGCSSDVHGGPPRSLGIAQGSRLAGCRALPSRACSSVKKIIMPFYNYSILSIKVKHRPEEGGPMAPTVIAIEDMSFPERLASLRKEQGLTQQALAERVGVHVTQLRRDEAGTAQPTFDVVRRIAISYR